MNDLAEVLYVDIETIPDQRPGALEKARSRVKVPGNYKKEETIAAYVNENADVEYRRTALDGLYGEVLMIGLAFDDEEAIVIRGDTEANTLTAFWGMIKNRCTASTRWVGHNITNFDLPFLIHRSIINYIEVPFRTPFGAPPWDSNVFDTSYAWTQQRNRGVKLDDLAEALGLIEPNERTMTGADVWDAVQADRLDEIAAYCAVDVNLTRDIYKRLFPYLT